MTDVGDLDYDDIPQSDLYCRHWLTLWDCDLVCATCGHRCQDHEEYGLDTSCDEKDCTCESWKEPTE